MKKSLIILMGVLALLATSCLEDDEEDTTGKECAIYSFSVADIESDYTTTTSAGKDTTYTRTIDGDEVFFNIDQVKHTISSVDSLPSWVNISRVVPSVSYSGSIYFRHVGDSLFYSFSSGKDSVDFTKPVEFMVVSTDAQSYKIYTANIYKATYSADTLYWQQQSGSTLSLTDERRAVVLDGQVYVFDNHGGKPTVTRTTSAGSSLAWSAAQAVSGTDATLNYKSVTPWNGNLFALDANGTLYRSTAVQAGESWTKASDVTLQRLLASDDCYLYAYDGTHLLQTADLVSWTEASSDNMDYLPEMPVFSAAYATKTNQALQNVVMVGQASAVTDYSVAWYKISASDNELNQPWSYIGITDDNSFALPLLQSLCVVRYDDALLAWGNGSDIYRSDDNGITWHQLDGSIALPAAANTSGAMTAVALNGYIWLIDADGKVWRGVMGN